MINLIHNNINATTIESIKQKLEKDTTLTSVEINDAIEIYRSKIINNNTRCNYCEIDMVEGFVEESDGKKLISQAKAENKNYNEMLLVLNDHLSKILGTGVTA